jgi:hypothetical protein
MGRPLGSRNKPKTSLPNDLLDELREQDEEFVERDNRKVLDVANGSNDSDNEESSESDDDFAIEFESTKVPPSTAPPPKTSKPAKKAKAVITGRVKKPLDAVVLTQRNLDLFMRNVEANKNLQYELLNTNLLSLSSSVEKSTKTICKAITNLSESLFNMFTNNSNLGLHRAVHEVKIKKEPKSNSSDIIVLDSSPTLPVKTLAPRQLYPMHESTAIQSQSGATTFRPENQTKVQPVKLEPSKVDYERLIALTGKTNDISKMAIIAFQEFWAAEKRAGLFKSGEYNVYGMVPMGSKEERKPLDYQRLTLMQSFLQDKMPHGMDKEGLWRACVRAINKKLHTYKEKAGGVKDESFDEDGGGKRGDKLTLYNDTMFKCPNQCDGPIFYQ